jgi:HEPN domain-containing protein
MIQKDLDTLSITPVSGIYKNYISFNYTQPDALKDFGYGNTLVQAHLPYCLHLPNHYEMTVEIPERDLRALVIFEKIWTNRARADHTPSDSTDVFADNRVLYFKNSTILTPKMPFNPEEGWDSFFTGKNIERMKDQNGVFRFTLVHIQFDAHLPEELERLGQAALEDLLRVVQEQALAIINRVIDTNRGTTKEIHVRRLGELKVNLIYFLPRNQGFYILLPNIETAQMNRSRLEIETISEHLSSGKRPEIHTLLALNARSSMDTGDYTLAIVESFQALEIFLENYLRSILRARGDSDEQIVRFLKTNWMTKDRLTTVLKSLKGSSLNERRDIWDRWCTRYDKTRNEVLHAGKEPTRKETEDTLAVNEITIHWLLSL